MHGHLYVILPFRARGTNVFRQNQLDATLTALSEYIPNPKTFIVAEQDDDNVFNRGLLLNAAFLENEKLVVGEQRRYAHHNVDLRPDPTLRLIDYNHEGHGFVDMYGFEGGLGGVCTFSPSAFYACNGFPNDFGFYADEDLSILARIQACDVPLVRPKWYNTGMIEDKRTGHAHDVYKRVHALNRAKLMSEVSEPLGFMNNGLHNSSYACVCEDRGHVRWMKIKTQPLPDESAYAREIGEHQ